jgi:hypothetical protein
MRYLKLYSKNTKESGGTEEREDEDLFRGTGFQFSRGKSFGGCFTVM